MNWRSPCSPRSITVTMFGCESVATDRASRRKRSTYSPSPEYCSWRIFSATLRSSSRSCARKTLDMPPVPTSSSSSYRSARTSPTICGSGYPRRAGLKRRREGALPRRASASSSSTSVMTSGTSTRMQLPATPALRSRSAARKRLFDDAGSRLGVGRPSGVTSSIASIAPRPRTSPIAGQLLLPRKHARPHDLADRVRALEEALLLDDVEHGERGRLRDRVADVGSADAAEDRRVHDRRPSRARRRAGAPWRSTSRP